MASHGEATQNDASLRLSAGLLHFVRNDSSFYLILIEYIQRERLPIFRGTD